MTPEEYNWETWFETAQNIMCHKFTERVDIRTDLSTGLIRIFKDGNEISRIDGSGMPMRVYEQLLVRTATEALQLSSINK